MKKKLFWMAGLLVAVAVIIGASQLWAEGKEKKPAPTRTRIAFLNLTYVVKNYDKYKEWEVEIKKSVVPYQERDAELQAKLKELREQAENPALVPAKAEDRKEKGKKAAIEEKAKKIQQDIDDNNAEIKLKLGKRSDEEMKTLYTDVMEATQRYANAHDLDLVLQYNDAVTQEDFVSAQNIARKLSSGALMPLYWNPSMDISQDLVAFLNRKMHKD
jgi:Skp family chaperone for outer membrane proteins